MRISFIETLFAVYCAFSRFALREAFSVHFSPRTSSLAMNYEEEIKRYLSGIYLCVKFLLKTLYSCRETMVLKQFYYLCWNFSIKVNVRMSRNLGTTGGSATRNERQDSLLFFYKSAFISLIWGLYCTNLCCCSCMQTWQFTESEPLAMLWFEFIFGLNFFKPICRFFLFPFLSENGNNKYETMKKKNNSGLKKNQTKDDI